MPYGSRHPEPQRSGPGWCCTPGRTAAALSLPLPAGAGGVAPISKCMYGWLLRQTKPMAMHCYLAVQHVGAEVAYIDRIRRARYDIHQRQPCFYPLQEVGQLHTWDRKINRTYFMLMNKIHIFPSPTWCWVFATDELWGWNNCCKQRSSSCSVSFIDWFNQLSKSCLYLPPFRIGRMSYQLLRSFGW